MIQKKSKGIVDFLYVIGANILAVVAGMVSAFLIPGITGVEQFGYYRIFTFYIIYLGFLHFGFNDGIYVRYGSYDYEKLPKEKFRAYFLFLTLFQAGVTFLLILACKALIGDPIKLWIFVFVSLNVIIANISGYFSVISQITRRFGIYSINTALVRVLYVVSIFLLMMFGIHHHIYYIAAQTIINIISMLIYMVNAKELVFGVREGLAESASDIARNFRIGFLVMIGNFMSLAILGTGQFFVERFMPIQDYAMYAFSISLLTLFTILLGAVSTVTYPYLARADRSNAGVLYEKMERLILVVLSISLAGYFIIKLIVLSFLQEYTGALSIAVILFPVALLNGLITIVPLNFYKVLGLQKDYTLNNLAAFCVGVGSSALAYYFFRSTAAIAAAVLITFCLWGAYSDHYFKRKIGVSVTKIHGAVVSVIIAFLLSAWFLGWIAGLIVYSLSTLVILVVFYKNDLIMMMKQRLDYFKV